MKKPILLNRNFLIILAFLFFGSSFITNAQNSPEAINYQAVARNIDGEPLSNIDLEIEVGIIQGLINNPAVYSEIHSVTTDDFGLFALKIGEGAPLSGDFSQINWGLISLT